jgi:hypothetical protein
VRNGQFPFGTHRHQGQRFNPAADYAGHREFSRSPRATELSKTVPSISLPV